MRKSEGPWYRKFNNTWYATVHGDRWPPGKHPEGAPPPKKGKRGWNAPDAILTAFHQLMAAETPQPLRPADTCVTAVLDLFLDHSQRHNKPRTYEWYKSFLQDFSDRYGRLKVEDLKPFHVTRWLDSHPAWKGARWGPSPPSSGPSTGPPTRGSSPPTP